MRFFTAGLILVTIVMSAALAQETSLENLPYEELLIKLDGAKDKGSWPEVVSIADAMIRKCAGDPDEERKNAPEPRYWRAYALLQMGKLEEALQGFDEVIRLNKEEGILPRYPEAYMGRARVYSVREQHALDKNEKLTAAEEGSRAKEEILTAVGEGCTVREIQAIPELKKYLQNPKFFIEVIEQEPPPPIDPLGIDPFVCPLRPPGPEDEGLTEKQQCDIRDQMENLCKEAEDAADFDTADDRLAVLKEQYETYVEGGKITIKEVRKEIEEIRNRAMVVRRRLIKEYLEREVRKLKEEAEKLLKDLRSAFDERDRDSAERINTELVNRVKERLDLKEQEFEPLRELAKKYDAERAEIYNKRMPILTELSDLVSPHIRLSATITGIGVDSIAYLETNFGGNSVTHRLKENESLPGPFPAHFTLTKIEDDRVITDYKKDVVKLKDGRIITGKIVEETEKDIKVETQSEASVTVPRGQIGDRGEVKEVIEILMSGSFSRPLGGTSASGSKTP
jgi:tetratricopeptide (TPR) repeat protein